MTRRARDDDGNEPFRAEDVLCKRQTDKAILCVIDSEDVWVPLSIVHDDSEVYAQGHEGTLVVPKWFARKNGLCD